MAEKEAWEKKFRSELRGGTINHLIARRIVMSDEFGSPKVVIDGFNITGAIELADPIENTGMIPLLDNTTHVRAPLLIIAENVIDEALDIIVVNKLQGILKVVAIKVRFQKKEKGYASTCCYPDRILWIEGEVVVDKVKASQWEIGDNTTTDKL
ncbi:hypothetical protein Cgig2_025800 [Carnegiea gigantea]|uniref:Uncharacterized protein n=1 Tax=Carnegiea gigantea TaxID=171969 RepID=A0A9Q1KEZ9_9CARY|nr:hypothetical protein Cgig2_025800 [Carnegiea gigantea]